MPEMKLYILQPIVPWKPWYDKMFGIIVRATTAKEAREMAQSEAGDESRNKEVWLMPQLTTCELLKVTGEKGMVLRDYWAA